ncbi:MAG: hypothetical protein A2Y17_00690 [Clostridiales bacterium GWF2_38_85]|nr:MAG: hypothetical protein A2Y17_00690 [Clostridiales bacterium GWF2_38_85]
MTTEIKATILKMMLRKNYCVEMSVTGNSMYPQLKEGDSIFLRPSCEYTIGDIIVFIYKNDLLIHRLIKIKDDIYYCKGDSSFRLEDIKKEDIIGSVQNMSSIDNKFIEMSLSVNEEFVSNGYEIEATKASDIYLKYKNQYLEGVTYVNNEKR